MRDVGLTAGRHVEVEPFLGDEARHGDAEERLARVGDGAVAERGTVLTAASPQLVLVVHIERRAERVGEPGEIAAPDREAAVAVDGRGTREQAQVDRGGGRVVRHHSSSGSSASTRAISSGAWTPRIASALAKPEAAGFRQPQPRLGERDVVTEHLAVAVEAVELLGEVAHPRGDAVRSPQLGGLGDHVGILRRARAAGRARARG